MRAETYREPRGTRWTFEHEITDEGEAKNCTGLNAVMVLKSKQNVDAPLIAKSYIDWTNITEGKGYYTFTPSQTIMARPEKIYFQCYLFDPNDEDSVESRGTGVIMVQPTLKYPVVQ